MYNHYTHQLLSLIITCHQFVSSLYDAPTIPFSSWGWDPTHNIYFMTVWTHSSSCSARCIPWYVLNCYIEQSFDHKSCVESMYLKESHKKSTTIPSPRPSKVSASPCATVSLWKNPLVAVEVLFHWLKPPMEVRHDHEVKPFTWFLRPCCVSWDMRSLCQVCHGTLWFPSLLDRAWLKTTGRWLMILRWEWSFQDLKFVTSRGTYKSC